MSKASDLLERVSTLQRSEMRRFAQKHGLHMVHLEVLSYLAKCNRYSNTTLALSEYLGQTKGSISQTVTYLENEGYLHRVQDGKDKRVFHLTLLANGRNLVNEYDAGLFGDIELEHSTTDALELLIREAQKKQSYKSFGICSTCRFNSSPTARKFLCLLTGENLSVEETELHCKEHEFP